MTPDANSAKGIFLAAIHAVTPADRDALLDRECADDPGLRGRVLDLLRAHEGSDSLLDRPLVERSSKFVAAGISTDDPSVTDAPPERRGVSGSDAELRALLAPALELGSLGRLDHYEVQEVIGRGGMGIVLKARDTKLQRIVAIKLLAPQLAASGSARRRFVREAQAAAAVRDDHVVSIHAVEDTGPIPYLVMEYVGGMTLDERLRRSAPLEIADLLRIGMQSARGLAAAHAQGLIHRDVKPANILLENGVQRVKLTDFGLARAADDASITQSGMIAGTPLYMSPEQARGERLSHRSDLFSLGSVLYTLVAGQPAFQAESMTGVIRKVCEDAPRPIKEANPISPDWLDGVIRKLMAKDPADRFQSAAEVADLLGQYLAFVQQPHSMTPPALVEGAISRHWADRRNIARATVGLAAVAIVGLAIFLWPKGKVSNGSAASRPAEQSMHHPRTAAELAAMKSPFDGRNREKIPNELLALAGGGDADAAPAELVAVLANPPSGPLENGVPQRPRVYAAVFDADGRRLATANGDGALRVWDLANWPAGQPSPPMRVLGKHDDRVWDVAFDAAGARLATGSYDGTLCIWDASTGRKLRTLPGHQPFGSMVAFTPDDRTLAVGRTDGTLRFWDVASGTEANPISGHAGHVIALAYSLDGRFLASAGFRDQTVILRDAKTLELIRSFRFGERGIGSVAFSPDGGTLAACGSGGQVQLWDVESGRELGALAGHTGLVEGLAFHPAGRLSATSSDDGTVRLWDLATSSAIHVWGPGPFGKMARRLTFTPEGRYLATANFSGTVTILRTPAD